jgi:hypothetical protein
VLSSIQKAIDATHLPFPNSVRRHAEAEGLEARVTRLETVIEFQRSLAEMKAELQTMRTDARSYFWLILSALIVIALGLAWLLTNGFRWA